jgi:hypothetical protein
MAMGNSKNARAAGGSTCDCCAGEVPEGRKCHSKHGRGCAVVAQPVAALLALGGQADQGELHGSRPDVGSRGIADSATGAVAGAFSPAMRRSKPDHPGQALPLGWQPSSSGTSVCWQETHTCREPCIATRSKNAARPPMGQRFRLTVCPQACPASVTPGHTYLKCFPAHRREAPGPGCSVIAHTWRFSAW